MLVWVNAAAVDLVLESLIGEQALKRVFEGVW